MSREILFRGRSFSDGSWVYGDLEYERNKGLLGKVRIHTYKDDGIYDRQYLVDPYTVGEFTGMTDKNGVKVFEGDIVKVYDDANNDTDIGVVKYNEDFGKYIVVYSQASGNWFDFEGTDGEFLAAFCSEVIGNIHDSPELLSTE